MILLCKGIWKDVLSKGYNSYNSNTGMLCNRLGVADVIK